MKRNYYSMAVLIFLSMFFMKGCTESKPPSIPPTPTGDASKPATFTYELVNSYPHDSKAFTQGLLFYNGYFYESTGEEGQSSVRQVELTTGKVLKITPLAADLFGEGLTILNGKIYQITWEDNKAFVYDLNTLQKVNEQPFQYEGWGLTNDGKNLIATDGSNVIRFLNPENYQTVTTIEVKNKNTKVNDLNELEYIKGEIWANIWHKDLIVRVDPKDGRILAWVDLTGLRPQETLRDGESVLNGIAYDEQNDRLFVTGKRWPKIFEIKLKPKQ
jgi:glutaminyl-peptide cyclotransferase